MPNCFLLTRKGEKEPMALQAVDALICQHFNVPCDPEHWHHGWYNYIGFLVAMGKDWAWLEADMREEMANDQTGYWEHMLAILLFLRENFFYNAWAEIGR